jgi:hypothetical protein
MNPTKHKQRSTKHTYKTKDRVIWTLLNTGGEFRCSGRVSSSYSTSATPLVNLVTNPVISHEWGEDREVFSIETSVSDVNLHKTMFEKSGFKIHNALERHKAK